MSKSLLPSVLALPLLWITSFNYSSARANELDSKLSATVRSYHLDADNLPHALIRVAQEFRIPMGIQWVNTPAARTKLALSWGDVTVREILETIAKTQPGYEVAVSNGVVQVFTTNISPKQNFLLLRVRSFEVHQEVVQMAERELRSLVMLKVVPPKEGAGGVGRSLATNVDEPTIDVQLNDASVQDILDSLATVSTKKIWIVTFVDSSALTATGFRRTLTLWNNSPVPDEEQPVWNMFRWDEAIP